MSVEGNYWAATRVIFTCVVLLAPLPVSAQRYDVNVLVREIQSQVRDDPELHGAWLHVEFDDQGDPGVAPGCFTFRRVLDSGCAELQKAKLSRLIQVWVPGGNFQIEASADRQYPFSRLMENLDYAMSVHPGLAGALVRDGYYEPSPGDPDRVNLVLQGRVMSEQMGEKVEMLCNLLMRSDPSWVRKQESPMKQIAGDPLAGVSLEISPSTKDLEVIDPSDGQASWSFSRGVQLFWKCDYSAACDSFREATLESPKKMKAYYWQSLADIAAGRRDKAYERMYYVARTWSTIPYSTEHREVIRSMERVQGPLRSELQHLEARALGEVSRMKAPSQPLLTRSLRTGNSGT